MGRGDIYLKFSNGWVHKNSCPFVDIRGHLCNKDTMNHPDPTYEVIGSAMRVHNELGPGLREKPYENAMAIDFREQGIAFINQHGFPILYHDQPVGHCVPDFTIGGEVVVEIKSIDKIGDSELAQMINYLRISGIRLGLIINFRNPKVEWKRVVK